MDISDAIELYSQYILVEKGLLPSTLENYKEDLYHFFKFFPDKHTTDDLYSTDLMDYFRYQLENELTVSTALRRLSATKSFYLFLSPSLPPSLLFYFLPSIFLFFSFSLSFFHHPNECGVLSHYGFDLHFLND